MQALTMVLQALHSFSPLSSSTEPRGIGFPPRFTDGGRFMAIIFCKRKLQKDISAILRIFIRKANSGLVQNKTSG